MRKKKITQMWTKLRSRKTRRKRITPMWAKSKAQVIEYAKEKDHWNVNKTQVKKDNEKEKNCPAEAWCVCGPLSINLVFRSILPHFLPHLYCHTFYTILSGVVEKKLLSNATSKLFISSLRVHFPLDWICQHGTYQGSEIRFIHFWNLI